MKDMEWATNTCTITFATLGIWPENADGTDINGCDRSHDSRLMATGDDFGKVRLFSYPVIQPKVYMCYKIMHLSSYIKKIKSEFCRPSGIITNDKWCFCYKVCQ